MGIRISILASCLAASLSWAAVNPRQRAIDTRQSRITVYVFKTGAFSAFAHDHVIDAPITGGKVDTLAHQVELHLNAAVLRVCDAKASEKDRAEIQETMLGADVLDTGRYPEIAFRSTAVEPVSAGAWKVHGMLTLHGQTKDVAFAANQTGGSFTRSVVFRQSDFGIKPLRIAGGAIRVKDAVRIQFDIRLAR